MPSSSSGFSPSSGPTEEKTHYDVLEIENPDNCELSDIKKAYRKLALMYHPDRVPPDRKEEATVKFREVSEAYQVLSDENSRAEYDYSLKHKSGNNAGTEQNPNYHGGYNMHTQTHMHTHRPHHPHHYRDPFNQFNDLFRNDPFFSAAFKDMDDLFAKTFRDNNKSNNNNNNNNNSNVSKQEKKKKGWGGWLLDCLGIQVHSSSTYVNADGTFTTSSYGHSQGTYTSKSTRTIIENGRRITIQSMEKDGNRIEERYDGDKLVQRLINGRPQNVGRIAAGDL